MCVRLCACARGCAKTISLTNRRAAQKPPHTRKAGGDVRCAVLVRARREKVIINACSLDSHEMDYIIERQRKLNAADQADAVDWIRAVLAAG